MYVCTKVCVYLCVRLPSFSLTVRSLSHALSRRQVKRKYGTKVQELQKECVNKRRRANLPKSAVEVRFVFPSFFPSLFLSLSLSFPLSFFPSLFLSLFLSFPLSLVSLLHPCVCGMVCACVRKEIVVVGLCVVVSALVSYG